MRNVGKSVNVKRKKKVQFDDDNFLLFEFK